MGETTRETEGEAATGRPADLAALRPLWLDRVVAVDLPREGGRRLPAVAITLGEHGRAEPSSVLMLTPTQAADLAADLTAAVAESRRSEGGR